MYVINKYDISLFKILLFACSVLAASGSAIYGWRFVERLPFFTLEIRGILGVLCAMSAFLGNLVLSFYALLLTQKFLKEGKKDFLLFSLAAISTVPTAVIAFNAYRFDFSALLTLIGVINIYLVNVGINYMALVNHFAKRRVLSPATQYIGYALSVIISVPIFSASIWGVQALLVKYAPESLHSWPLSILVGILVGFPGLFLMVDSSLEVVASLQQKRFSKREATKHGLLHHTMLAVACLSGSAYAEISLEFMNGLLNEWGFNSHFLILVFQGVFVPLIFMCSSAVNYIALKGLLRGRLEARV